MSSLSPRTKEPDSRIICLDFGLARIGIAMSDLQKIIATPLSTFICERKTVLTVQKLAKELKQHAETNRYTIQEIVIGMPFLMSGKKGILADEVVHFIELLKAEIDSPIFTWDERLTSVQAEKSLREGNLTRKKRTRYVDVVAATLILQNYLDYKKLQMT
jgi:putative holliday junction resolvase